MLRYGIRLSVAVVTFLFSLLISAGPTLSPPSAPAWRGGVSEQEVLGANREYLEAHVSRDVDALDRLLAEEFTIAGRYGRSSDKAQRLAMVSDPELTFRYADRGEPRVWAGADFGEVTGMALVHGSYMGREFTSPPYRYVRRFEKRDGRWQLVSVEFFRRGWN